MENRIAMVLELALCLALLGQPQSRPVSSDCHATTYGECHKVRGRYGIYANNDYLWIVGTKHMLVATDDKLDDMLEEAGWQDHFLFGDFVVCPTSPYSKGHLQVACIQSYTNIRMTGRQ